MNQMTQGSFDNYSIAGDVAVIALCGVVVILLMTSYVSHNKSFHIFMNIIFLLVAAALVNIGYHLLLVNKDPGLFSYIYALRTIYHALLFNVFFLFTLYATVVTGMQHRQARKLAVFSALLLVVIVGIDIIRTVGGNGFQIAADGTVINKTNVFMIGYILFVILIVVLLTRVKNLLYKRVAYGFFATMILAVALRFAQLPLNQSSLTTMTFVFPVIAMLYIIHSNPYDVTLGTVDIRAMKEMIHNMYMRNAEFVFMSILIPDYNEEGKELPEDIRAVVRRFSGEYLRGSVMFQLSNGNIVLIAPKKRNYDYKKRIQDMLEGFQEQYQRFHLPYKIVIGESMDEISRRNEYASLIRSIQRSIPENTLHRVTKEDISRFNKKEYILHELADIYNKSDIEDPRVLVFCQPVFNLRTGRFDTAEALMRLKLEKTGIVYPDQFIPLAEAYGYIHVLTEIILNKTCRAIRKMNEEGFRIGRISVNVSVLELKDDKFCADINKIIDDNSVSGKNIAIELTESRSEADFMIMKEKIEELRGKEIQFYLDDFGTGYSNMERIMELPFDIIKFDRSLVIASRDNERSEKIVDNLAQMFKDMEYSVLYEGVEDDIDEERCKEMSASYLQGYKYSRPVPIEQLKDFLPRSS